MKLAALALSCIFSLPLAVLPARAQQNVTATALNISPDAIIAGSSATLTATVTRASASGYPAGTVAFSSEGRNLGTASLNGTGVAAVTASSAGIALGNYPVIATYKGDSTDAASTSPAVYAYVQSATVTTFTVAPTSVQQNQPAVLTANVTRTGHSGFATGTVTFLSGTYIVATAALVNGIAQTAASASVALNSYNLVAHYNGDSVDQSSTSTTLTVAVTPAVDVLTERFNVARTGVQPAEAALTPANLSASTFGKVFTFTTDGYAYSQALYVSNYTMHDGKSHNVLFVATAAGSVYAFDADNNNPQAGYLWHISVIPANEQLVNTTDMACEDITPTPTIIGTPVIDRPRGILYLVSKTKLVAGSSTTFVQRIHAINLADGTERLNGPTVITASVPGTAGDAVDGTVAFNPQTQNQRAALLESNGSIWISWASHCDRTPYHGWTLGYNAGDVSQQTAVFNNTPNGAQGGIWMSGGGISTDNLGNLYTAAGNGTFDLNSGGSDYGDALQRFDINSGGLVPRDWFVPSDQAWLADEDADFGMVAPLIFNDPASGVAPRLITTADKSGRIYLLNRDSLGSYDSGSNGPDSLNGDLQDFAASNTIFSNFIYFNQRLYVGVGQSPIYAYAFNPGTANTAGFFDTTPAMSTTATFPGRYSFSPQPVISANGSGNAVLWAIDFSGANDILYAFDANALSNQLYASSTNSSDQGPPSVKFSVPVVANGRVYVAGQGLVAVYGLLAK